MRVLIMSANNADERHVNMAINLVEQHGHQVVRWDSSITDNSFDTAIIIPGDHNKDVIYSLWKNYENDDELELLDETDDDVYLGKGLYSFICNTNKSTHLMIYPDLDQTTIEQKYFRNNRRYGPCFVQFDRSDIEEHDEADYKFEHGMIDLSIISDKTARMYHTLSRHLGFEVEANYDIDKETIVSPSVNENSVVSTSNLDLLLLKRV